MVIRFLSSNAVHEEGLRIVVLGAASNVTEGDGVANSPPDDAAKAGVEDVLQ